jgi:hypothetical protein
MSKKVQKRSKGKSALAALLFAGLMASGTYAFTASNTVPASKAGDGTGAVSGYTASTVHYVLDATDPTKADSVTFNLDSAPGAVKALVVTGGTWYSCTNAGTAVTCTLGASGVSVSSINTLRVIAAD